MCGEQKRGHPTIEHSLFGKSLRVSTPWNRNVVVSPSAKVGIKPTKPRPHWRWEFPSRRSRQLASVAELFSTTFGTKPQLRCWIERMSVACEAVTRAGVPDSRYSMGCKQAAGTNWRSRTLLPVQLSACWKEFSFPLRNAVSTYGVTKETVR